MWVGFWLCWHWGTWGAFRCPAGSYVSGFGEQKMIGAKLMQPIESLTEGDGDEETKRGHEEPQHLNSWWRKEGWRRRAIEWECRQSGDRGAKSETVYTWIHKAAEEADASGMSSQELERDRTKFHKQNLYVLDMRVLIFLSAIVIWLLTFPTTQLKKLKFI